MLFLADWSGWSLFSVTDPHKHSFLCPGGDWLSLTASGAGCYCRRRISQDHRFRCFSGCVLTYTGRAVLSLFTAQTSLPPAPPARVWFIFSLQMNVSTSSYRQRTTGVQTVYITHPACVCYIVTIVNIKCSCSFFCQCLFFTIRKCFSVLLCNCVLVNLCPYLDRLWFCLWFSSNQEYNLATAVTKNDFKFTKFFF